MRKITLALALVGVASVAGATGLAVYRHARMPLVVLNAGEQASAYFFFDGGRALVVWPAGGRVDDPRADLWSAETRERFGQVSLPRWDVPFAHAIDSDVVAFLTSGVNGPNARVNLLAMKTGVRRTIEARQVRGLALSPRGDLVALALSNTVEVRSTLDGTLTRVLEDQGGQQPVFSLDGELVAIDPGLSIHVWSLHEPRVACVISGSWVAGFTSRREVLVAHKPASDLVIVDAHSVEDGRLLRNVYRGEAERQFGSDAFTQEKDHANQNGFDVDVYSTLDSVVRRRFYAVLAFSLSPKGDRIAVTRGHGRVEVWEIPP